MTKPRPIRPITAQSMISTSAVPRSTASISEERGREQQQAEATPASSPAPGRRVRPANGIVTASAIPAGSSTAPACDGGRCSAACMNTGTR